MSIEGIPELDCDGEGASKEIERRIGDYEANHTAVVGLNASLTSWDNVQAAICGLRSANVSALLSLRKSENTLDDDEILYLFQTLKDWDQLYLQNFLEVCGEWVPQEFQQALITEAKIELKWVKEWLTATSDPRVTKYPSLPWRSFIRKIVSENHAFAVRFLELAAAPATQENVAAMSSHILKFLEAKKKVVCVFPKKWKESKESLT